MTQIKNSIPEQGIQLFAAALAFCVSGLFLVLHAALIPHPGPHEYREGAMLVTTQYLLDGENPYAAEHLPLSTNAYGLLYNYAVYPLAVVFGNTFTVHRVVTAIFILGSCLLLYLFLSRICKAWLTPILGAAFLYCLLVFNYGVCARPDYMGVFFYLLGIYLPWRSKFSKRSLLIAYPFFFLAFMAKPYFLLGIGVIAVFLFLQKSKGFSVLYFAVAITLTAGLVALLTIPFPYYLYCTFGINQSASSLSKIHLMAQLGAFTTLHAGILLGLAVVLLQVVRQSRSQGTLAHRIRAFLGGISFFGINRPLIARPVSFHAIHLLVSFAAVAYLGQHAGAFLIYFVCLLSPALLIYFFHVSEVLEKRRLISICGISLSFLILALLKPPKPTPVIAIDHGFALIFTESKNVFFSSVLVHYALGSTHDFYSSGQTHYFRYPFKGTTDRYSKERQLYQSYLKQTRSRIEAQDLDYILTDPTSHDELEIFDSILTRYQLRYTVDYPLFYGEWLNPQEYGLGIQSVFVWIPRDRQEEVEESGSGQLTN